jgi:hypothetical protein
MDIHFATETAYKNGYEQGKKDAITNILNLLINEHGLYSEDGLTIVCVNNEELEEIAAKICNR